MALTVFGYVFSFVFLIGSAALCARFMQEDCHFWCKLYIALGCLLAFAVASVCAWYFEIDEAAVDPAAVELRLPDIDVQNGSSQMADDAAQDPVLESLPPNRIFAFIPQKEAQLSKIPIQSKIGTSQRKPSRTLKNPSLGEIKDGILRPDKSGLPKKHNINRINKKPRLEKLNFYHPQAKSSKGRWQPMPPAWYYLKPAIHTDEDMLALEDDNPSQQEEKDAQDEEKDVKEEEKDAQEEEKDAKEEENDVQEDEQEANEQEDDANEENYVPC